MTITSKVLLGNIPLKNKEKKNILHKKKLHLIYFFYLDS